MKSFINPLDLFIVLRNRKMILWLTTTITTLRLIKANFKTTRWMIKKEFIGDKFVFTIVHCNYGLISMPVQKNLFQEHDQTLVDTEVKHNHNQSTNGTHWP